MVYLIFGATVCVVILVAYWTIIWLGAATMVEANREQWQYFQEFSTGRTYLNYDEWKIEKMKQEWRDIYH